jgi:hypothetical protein
MFLCCGPIIGIFLIYPHIFQDIVNVLLAFCVDKLFGRVFGRVFGIGLVLKSL